VVNWTRPSAIQAPLSVCKTPIQLFVIHANGQDTAATIRAAGLLAQGLNAEITVLAAIEVPFPLPLEHPPVAIEFTENQFRHMLRGCALLMAQQRYAARTRCSVSFVTDANTLGRASSPAARTLDQ